MSSGSVADDAFQLLCEQHTFVVIDTETTPSEDGNRIIQLGAVTIRHGRILPDQYETKLDPGVPITNTRHHTLTDADVVGAPSFTHILDPLAKLLDGDDIVLVCHNAKFDVGVLHREYERLGNAGTLSDLPVLDTMYLPDIVGHQMPTAGRSLPAVMASLGVINSLPHHALYDARATAEVLLGLLRIAAANGQVQLDVLLAELGDVRTSSIKAASGDNNLREPAHPELPEDHVKTHNGKGLGKTAAASTLDRWTAQATECVELRCHLLEAKATTSQHHAAKLHAQLTKLLTRRHETLEPGQGATLVAALNILATNALRGGNKSKAGFTWWRKHRDHVLSLARCTDQEACPDCRHGDPCPIDLAHQPIATTVVYASTDRLTEERRDQVSETSLPTSFVNVWTAAGSHDLAGYAAWLAADAWLADGLSQRAAGVIDHALARQAYDPRILRLYAEQLALQQREDDLDEFVTGHLPNRTTDPGWDELALWYDRHQARRLARRRQQQHGSAEPSPTTRPRHRHRRPRFAVERGNPAT